MDSARVRQQGAIGCRGSRFDRRDSESGEVLDFVRLRAPIAVCVEPGSDACEFIVGQQAVAIIIQRRANGLGARLTSHHLCGLAVRAGDFERAFKIEYRAVARPLARIAGGLPTDFFAGRKLPWDEKHFRSTLPHRRPALPGSV